MIIDTHVWLSQPDSWGDLTMMDDAMIDAGWTEIGERTGLDQGMSGKQMVAYLGGNAARLLRPDGSDEDQQD